ncbi:MAG: hypothetical protein E7220_00545 [Clostridiales bacterium]|nr:hypothetical protein [Clostridiales bacterium]
MDKIRHGLTEYRMPGYVEEVLSQNYCSCFISMTIVKDKDSYRFSYDPGRSRKLDIASLDTYRKLILLKTLISISRRSAVHLIAPDSFLLEPELLYTNDNRVDIDSLRILFYPDVKMLSFGNKLRIFSDRLFDHGNREEREYSEQFRNSLEDGDINRAGLFLDKNILRLESRILS